MAPEFTICIPSWNRGQAALRQVLHTLPLIDAKWEILVLDNCSTRDLEGYKEISLLSKLDNRVKYIKHSQNGGFHGNIVSCLKYANSPCLQIISDEDYSNPSVVRDAIATLNEFPDVGLIRGSIRAVDGMTPRNSAIYTDQFLSGGRLALGEFSLTTNYVSGIIYNKRLLESAGVASKFSAGLLNNPMITGYAHMYLDILVSSCCSVITSSEIVCFEGTEYSTMTNITLMAQNEAYTFSSRLEQFIGFRNAFIEVCAKDQLNDLSLLVHLYLRLVQKYCTLFAIDGFLYSARGLNLVALKESLRHFFMAATEITEFRPVRDMVLDMVQERFERSLPKVSGYS
jgi:glycosyltransferase involved in cell wall biosynthesis